MLALTVAALPSIALAQDLADVEKLDRYLERLELHDLRIANYESELTRRTSDAERIPIARKLADLYLQRLLEVTEEEQIRRLTAGVERLTRAVPAVDSPLLRTVLLQAEYNRAEAAASRWIADPADAASKTEALSVLTTVGPEFAALAEQFRRDIADKERSLDGARSERARDGRERELAQLREVSARATFFGAWATYYRALLEDKPADAPEFAAAARTFRELLALEDDTEAAALDAAALALDNPTRASMLLGVALSEAARGRTDDALVLLELLRHEGVGRTMRGEAAFWLVWVRLRAGQFDEALQFAQDQIDGFSGPQAPGQAALCAALVEAAHAKASAVPAKLRDELSQTGLGGLIRLGELTLARRLIGKYPDAIPDDAGFFLRWLSAQDRLARAQEAKTADDYRAAAAALEQALAAPDAKTEPLVAAQARYALAWCRHQLGELEPAARLLDDAAGMLVAHAHESAPDAVWLLFQTYRRLATDAEQAAERAAHRSKAELQLQLIRERFPNHDYARQAAWQEFKLKQGAGGLAAARKAVADLAPDDPNYELAHYELCLEHYRQWTKVRGNAPTSQAAFESLRSAVNTYLKRPAADPERRLRCLLFLAEAALAARPPVLDEARDMLTRAENLAASLPAGHELLAAVHYRRFQLARLEKDEAAANAAARQVLAAGKGTVYEKPALLHVARQLEQAAGAATPADKTAAVSKALDIYERLVAAYGDTPEALTAEKNAMVSLSRLAEYQSAAGRYREAAASLEKLLAAFPRGKNFLRRAGLVHYRLGDHKQSLEKWRVLVRGLKEGSGEWYEAKFYQLDSLSKRDREAARKALEQFELLHPGLGGDTWQARFHGLKRSL